MENTVSEEEYCDGLSEKKLRKKKSGMGENDFVKLLQFHPCLLEKSQTPDMKSKKRLALEDMEEKIKKIHGVNMNTTQIRKKIENMKARVKTKGDKKKTGNLRRNLKDHEKQLLDLMDYVNHPVLNETPDAEQCCVSGISRDPDEDEYLVLQKEVLIEQKEVAKQKQDLNIQQKEIFALQKKKLLLEIELLKKQLNYT